MSEDLLILVYTWIGDISYFTLDTVIWTVVLLMNWLCLGERIHNTREVQVLGRDWKWSWFCLHGQWSFGPVFIQSRYSTIYESLLSFYAVLCLASSIRRSVHLFDYSVVIDCNNRNVCRVSGSRRVLCPGRWNEEIKRRLIFDK